MSDYLDHWTPLRADRAELSYRRYLGRWETPSGEVHDSSCGKKQIVAAYPAKGPQRDEAAIARREALLREMEARCGGRGRVLRMAK